MHQPLADPVAGTILVVDDDPEVRAVLVDAMLGLGHAVRTAASAEQALTVLETAPLDLVVTDVHMGAMSGVELCARIKSDLRWALLPVVIVTAVSDLDSRVAGLAAGADDFFAKPFDSWSCVTRACAWIRVKTCSTSSRGPRERDHDAGRTSRPATCTPAGTARRLAAYAVALGQALGVPAPLAPGPPAGRPTCTTSARLRCPTACSSSRGPLTRPSARR